MASSSSTRESEPSADLKELWIIVRADEKLAVERALQCVVGTAYTAMAATGRGLVDTPKRRWRFFRFLPFGGERAPAVLLPNIVFYVVLPDDMTDDVLRAVRAALHEARGSTRARGVAFVMPLGQSIPIDAPPRRRVLRAEHAAEGAAGAE